MVKYIYIYIYIHTFVYIYIYRNVNSFKGVFRDYIGEYYRGY